jgi:hypothetical protein
MRRLTASLADGLAQRAISCEVMAYWYGVSLEDYRASEERARESATSALQGGTRAGEAAVNNVSVPHRSSPIGLVLG